MLAEGVALSREDEAEADGTTAAALAAARPQASVGLDRRVGLSGLLAAVLGGAPRMPTLGRFRLDKKIGGGGMGRVIPRWAGGGWQMQDGGIWIFCCTIIVLQKSNRRQETAIRS